MVKRWLVALVGVVASGCVTSASGPAQVEIVYQSDGGFAPILLRLEVQTDGLTTRVGGGAPVTTTLSASRLASLRSVVHSSAFRALARSYVPAETCCDRRHYKLVVSQEQGEQTVETLDGVAQPDVLGRALLEINTLFVTLNGS